MVVRLNVHLYVAVGLVAFAYWLPVGVGAQTPLTPIIVELFTSQGCSSCPPADAILRSFERNQPIDGVVIVPLSEHLDVTSVETSRVIKITASIGGPAEAHGASV